jgi:hypothetical protein
MNMSIANTIMGRDLARMARDGGDTKLFGRPNTDPRVISEADFLQRHGITREQMAERDRELAHLEFEQSSVADLSGEPPDDAGDEMEIRNGVTRTKKTLNLKGLSPQRKRYALYHAWFANLTSVLEALEKRKVDLEAIIAAPVEAGFALRKGIRRTADFLLGRTQSGGEGEAEAMSAKLAIAQHRADAARVALPELEREIERARLRLKHLEGREADFLNPALAELADHLGALYLQQIERLRYTAGLLFGLSSVVRTYGDGFQEALENIKFPRMGLPSIMSADANAFVIAARGNTAVWRQVAESLRRDPRANVDGLVPKPLQE